MSLRPAFAESRARQSGPAVLRQRMLDGFRWTGDAPWLASDIADALHVSQLSVRRMCDQLAAEGLVEVVSRRPFTVRRVS